MHTIVNDNHTEVYFPKKNKVHFEWALRGGIERMCNYSFT